jgi:hypothetical protein
MPFVRMSSGAIVWAAHFMAIYGITALACARGFPAAVPWAIGIATALALAAVIVIIVFNARDWLTAAVAGLALIAIVWEAIPVLVVPACA